ncbi:MAG: DUF5958 family protein [Acidobacteriota bacterium]
MLTNILELAATRPSLRQATEWFAALGDDGRTEALEAIAACCRELRPRQSEVVTAAERAGLRDSDEPCVILKRSSMPERAIPRVLRLQAEHDRSKAFALLLALFSIAKERPQHRG